MLLRVSLGLGGLHLGELHLLKLLELRLLLRRVRLLVGRLHRRLRGTAASALVPLSGASAGALIVAPRLSAPRRPRPRR